MCGLRSPRNFPTGTHIVPPRDHEQLFKDGRAEKLQKWGQEAKEAFDAAVGKLTEFEHQYLSRGRKIGGWITMALRSDS